MNKVIQLDAIDRRILRALQDDGGLGQNSLAETVGASPASCWRRVRALEQAGVLGRTVRLIDPAAIGLGVTVLCHLRLRSHEAHSRRSLEEYVSSRSEVIECYSMSGEWDYLLRVAVADVASYETFLMRHLLVHPAVATASSHFALRQVKYTTALPID